MSKEKDTGINFGISSFEKSNVEGTVTLTCKDENVFKDQSGIDWDLMKKYDKYKDDYLTKAAEFSANQAKEIMLEDKKVNKVIVQLPFTTSKRGSVDVAVDREKTYPGMNGAPAVTKSAVKLVVVDPYMKVSKPYIKGLEAELTKAILNC